MILALVSEAAAFCGAYVGPPGEALQNSASEVVLVRQGEQTTLTLVSDFQGDATDFALLLPVPEVLGPGDVDVIDPDLLDWIDAYSTPREVEYTCESAFTSNTTSFGCGGVMGCDGGSTLAFGDTDDMAVAAWSEHGYDFVVLDAEQSAGLFEWLDTNGFAVPEGGEAMLQEYIDGGSYFLAARISLGAEERGRGWLWPIQIRYTTPVFTLPIRIGTISSPGVQEVVIYALTDPSDAGEVGITNYPQLGMPTECMLPRGQSLADWYTGRVAATHEAQGAGWIREYSWDLVPTTDTGYHCDPCTAEAVVPGGSFAPFGRDADDAHLTRLRVRYTPEEATQDLVLYESGVTGVNEQIKLVSPVYEIESLFPYCDEGWAPEPGECPDAPAVQRACSAPALPATAAGAFLALALLRRRRS